MLHAKNGAASYRLTHAFRLSLRPHVLPGTRLLLNPKIISNSYYSQSHSRYLSELPDEAIEYNRIDGVERLEKYAPGGYHPVMIGDVLHGHYKIVDKLGFGGYPTVWLARDDRLNRCVAVKVGVSSQPSTLYEFTILQKLHNSPVSTVRRDVIPSILDQFKIEGPNGTHTCYTMTPAQGNLKEASFSRLFPIQVARALAAKLAIAIALVHSQGFVHAGMTCLLPVLF